MRLHFFRFPVLLVFILSISVTSCLKDQAYNLSEIQSIQGNSPSVLSLGVYVSSQANFTIEAYPASANDTVVNLVPVELGGPSVAGQDIHVTLVENDQIVTAYNTANGTNYVPPTGMFTIVNNGGVVMIPKGSRTGYLQIKFIANNLIGGSYALGFTISSVAEKGYTISGNLNNGIVAIVAKNEWDADYQVTGWFFHPSVGRGINQVKHLSTISGTALQGGAGDLGTPFTFDVTNDRLQNWASGGFTSSGFMTLDNPGGTDYSSPSNGGNVPGDANFNSTIYNNTYDPATKTFYMHYGYVNGASIDQTGYTRQIYEKWVRIN
jgi:Domain of unknown function (DUF1735)